MAVISSAPLESATGSTLGSGANSAVDSEVGSPLVADFFLLNPTLPEPLVERGVRVSMFHSYIGDGDQGMTRSAIR